MRAFILAVTGLALAVAACSSSGTSVVEVKKPTQVASVLISLPSQSLVAGQTQRANVVVRDGNGAPLTDRAVAWSSSPATVATVTDSGIILGVSTGTATLSAVSEGVAGQAALNVIPPPTAAVARVVVTIDPVAVVVGQTAHATVILQDSDGNPLTGRAITWQSGSQSVATVSANGDVSAVAPGTATITAASEGKTGSASVSVSAPAPIAVASVSVSPSTASVQVGGTVQLSAVTRDVNGGVLTGRQIAWSSNNVALATVSSSGRVSAVAPGTAGISATSEGKTASASVSVSAAVPIPVASVSVSPSTASVQVGGTVQLSAVTRDANGGVLTGRPIAWSSNNVALATVSASGLVAVGGVGDATITATSENNSATSVVTGVAAGASGRCANEPSGMTLIKERAFNSLNEDPSWDTDASLSIVTDATAPLSPSNAIRATYPAGFPSGEAPGHAGVTHTPFAKVYICFAFKLSSNWVGNGSGTNKLMYEWTNAGKPSFFFSAQGSGGATLRPFARLQDMVSFPGGNGNLSPNLDATAEIIRGRWYQIEVYLQGNSAGSANGAIDWYLDGIHVGSVAGVGWTSGATTFNIFEFYPIWGGVDNTPAITATQTMDWDHVYLSGKN